MSAEQFVQLYQSKDYTALEEALCQTTTSSLKDIFDHSLSSLSQNSITLLKALCFGCQKRDGKHIEVIFHIYKECLKLLQSTEVNSKFQSEIICILNNEANNLEPDEVVSLITCMLEMIQQSAFGHGVWLKLFQKLLDIAQQFPSVAYEKSTKVVTGSDYKRYVIDEVCVCKWEKKSIVHIINVLKEVHLSSAEADVVIHKLLDELIGMDEDELPPLVFQILVLGSNCNKLQSILSGIISHFNELDKNCSLTEKSLHSDEISEASEDIISVEKLRSVEGTVLLYFINFLRQNQSLGKASLKLMKNVKQSLSSDVISPFFLAVCCALVQDSRYNEDTLAFLRSLIIKCLQDEYKLKACKSLNDHAVLPPNMNDLLTNVVKNCQQGWEGVITGLVDLSFNLMSSFGPKPGPFAKTFEKEIRKRGTPQEEACHIGVRILCLIFKLHRVSRNEIVNQLLNTIQISGNSPAYHYIDVVRSIAKYHPQAMLQCINQIKITLEDITMIHPHNVSKLLVAMVPLLKISSVLRNCLVLVLRKALSSRTLNSRLCAVHGFILFLKNFPLSEATTLSQVSSQSSQSIFSSSSLQSDIQCSQSKACHNKMLCMEIMQILKRCLLQQASIRSDLYMGLFEAVLSNPRLLPFVMENLLAHFRSFYEEDQDILPPVNVRKCLMKSDSTLQDPIFLLLTLIHQLFRLVPKLSDTNSIEEDELLEEPLSERIHNIFSSLTSRMCKCQPEDFDFERFLDQSGSMKSNSSAAFGLVISIHQVLIEYNYFQTSYNDGGCQQILNLHQCYKKIVDSVNGGKSTLDKSIHEMFQTSLSIHFLSNILSKIFFEDASPDLEELSSNENFLKHIMSSLQMMLTHLRDHGYFPGVNDPSSTWDDTILAVRACLHKFFVEKNHPDRLNVALSCLECLHIGLEYVASWQKSKVATFVAALCPDDNTEATQSDCLSKFLKRMQRVIIPFVTSTNPLTATEKKLLLQLVTTIETLTSLVMSHSTESSLEQSAEWIRKICIDNTIEDAASVKHLVTLHLHLSATAFEHPEVMFRDLACDIRIKVGLREDADDSEASSTYQIVNEENAQHLIPVIVKHAENIVADCDWLLQHIKGQMMLLKENKDSDCDVVGKEEEIQERRRKTENSICVRICTIAVGLLDLSLCDVDLSASIDCIINCFTTLFSFFTNLSKYYMWLYQHGVGSVPSKFEKLITFIGSELMRPVYSFIMHAQNVQSGKLDKTSSKKTKKQQGMSTSGKAKVLRESKSVARMVYSIEQHEHQLILLARPSKIDFMKSYHLPTSRDFRIRSDVIQAHATEDKENEDEEEEEEGNASKRPRLDI